MSCATSPCYRPLLQDSIRLLRILPNGDQNAPIHCQLFHYSLQGSGKRIHLYEALSYVWGDSDSPQSVYIGEHDLPVTKNLHAALSHLRNFSFERIIWVDAICIDQSNIKEKEQQIQFMPKIYSQANRVLVWLGETADNSDQALEEIRAAGGKATNSSNNKAIQSAVLALLERDWFQRIWVLQEVAAARQVLIMCGPTEVDGYAFCSGIDTLKVFYEARAELQSLIRSVSYLIRGAIFRPIYVMNTTGEVPQAICTLGELVDMYHNHEATLLHDKVYALLGMSGMSSDDLSKAKLLPNYEVKWEQLLKRLAKFLLCENISVETWGGKQIAVIKSKGCILGRVSSVQNGVSLDGRQGVEVIFKNVSGHLGYKEESRAHWNLHPPAKPIRDGDIICLLQGASKPTIIRLRKDHFAIIMIAASPLETGQTENEYIKWPKLFARDFLLVWDWGNSVKWQDLGEYNALVRTSDWVSKHSETELGGYLNKANRTWNVAMILDDLEEYKKADERLPEAIEGYEIAFRQEHLHFPEGEHGRTPLSWAAGNGYDTVVNFLLKKDNTNPDFKDNQSGRTPLSWAAAKGHEAVVELLLATGKVEADLQDDHGRTPLSRAAAEGHEAVVELLLANGKVEADLKDMYGRTPLSRAAAEGHEVVVELLLATGKVEADLKDIDGQTPLSWAAAEGHEAVVELLLATGKVEADLKDTYDQTPLSRAAAEGHEAVVELLLATGKVEADLKDTHGQTPLSWAAAEGHEAVVELLLATGKVEADLKDRYGRTPLSRAAAEGHEAVVELLLATGKVEADLQDDHGRTPLSWAAAKGHEAVVELLLATGKVEADLKDRYGRTPLFWAAAEGHEAVVELLLATGKVEADLQDDHDQTPLSWAAMKGHKAVVELLRKYIN